MMTTSERSSACWTGRAEPAHVVADVGDEEEVDAEARELLGQVLRVRVEDLAEQQLGSDGDNLSLHWLKPLRCTGWLSVRNVLSDAALLGSRLGISPPRYVNDALTISAARC